MAPRVGSSRGGVRPGSGRPAAATLSKSQCPAAQVLGGDSSAASQTDNTDAESTHSTRSSSAASATSAGAGASTDPLLSPVSRARVRKQVPGSEMTREELEQ
eukprot:1763989-Pleurochrysis_carterae.AAC.1